MALAASIVAPSRSRVSRLATERAALQVAVALLIDATIIRSVVLPSVMKLLGDWNWYLPRWLEWLPRLEVEARGAGVQERAVLD